MKKSRKWLFRISILIVIISVFFSLAVISNAYEYKANSYVEKITNDDSGVIIDYRFPADNSYVMVYDVTDNNTVVYRGTGVYHPVPFIPGHFYQIRLFPFGYPGGSSGLLVDSLPSTASMSLGYGFVYENGDTTGYATIPSPLGYYYYYSKNASGIGSHISGGRLGMVDQNGRTQVSTEPFSFDPPENSYVLSFDFWWSNISWESDPVPTGIVLDDIRIRAVSDDSSSIDNYLDWTNGLLGDINNSINGPATPVPPPNIDSVDDLQNMEEELLDYIDGEIGNLDSLLEGFNDVIMEIGPSLLFVSWIIDLFTSISFFTKLINVVISLGITSFVLNLVISFVHSRTENNKSREAHKDQKGG